jgi:modulator of FtsH protease
MNSGWNTQPDQPYGQSSMRSLSVAESSAEVRLGFIRQTYVLFMAGILTAIVAGFLCLTVPSLTQAAVGILRSPILAFGIIIGASIGCQVLANREGGVAYAGLFGFTSLIGFMFAPILAMYEGSAPGIVGQAAFLSTLVFGSLTAYAFVSRKDFSFLGGALFVVMLAVIGGALANMLWFKSSGFGYWLAWGSLLMSSGFVLYQTSNIIHEFTPRQAAGAALGLFVSFFNIFMSLLRILSGNRN